MIMMMYPGLANNTSFTVATMKLKQSVVENSFNQTNIEILNNDSMVH